MATSALLFIGGALGAGYLMYSATPKLTSADGVPSKKSLGPGYWFQPRGSTNRQPYVSMTPGIDPETGLPIYWKKFANGSLAKEFCDASGNPPPVVSNQ